MQIIKGNWLIGGDIDFDSLLLIVALAILAFGIAAEVMRRQDEWVDNGSRKEKAENDREA